MKNETNITNKQQELLLLFPKFRFLTRSHIQQFLTHKDAKTIQTWLTDLVQKEYLKKGATRSMKTFPPKPFVYFLDKHGITFLKDEALFPENFLVNLYRDDERSDAFIARCFLLVDICLALTNTASNKEKFHYFTKSDYILPDSQFNFLTDLHPHLCFTKKVNGRKTTWYLLEFFSSAFPRQEIRKRIHTYVRFLKENDWEESLVKTMPVILFVCPSNDIRTYVKHYLKRKLRRYEVEDFDISLALEKEIKMQGVRGDIWEEIF